MRLYFPLHFLPFFFSPVLIFPHKHAKIYRPALQKSMLGERNRNKTFKDDVRMNAHLYENAQKTNIYNYTFRQLPPINPLRIEVFGIDSLSMARK